MFELINKNNFVIAAKLSILSPLIALYSPVKHLFYPLLALVALDILTGVLKARHKGNTVTSAGLMKRKPKVVILWFIGLTCMLLADVFLKEVGVTGHWAAKIYMVFYAIYECLSILENLADMGMVGAKNIRDILVKKTPKIIREELKEIKDIKDKRGNYDSTKK